MVKRTFTKQMQVNVREERERGSEREREGRREGERERGRGRRYRHRHRHRHRHRRDTYFTYLPITEKQEGIPNTRCNIDWKSLREDRQQPIKKKHFMRHALVAKVSMELRHALLKESVEYLEVASHTCHVESIKIEMYRPC